MSRKSYMGVRTPHGVQVRVREGVNEEVLDLRLTLIDNSKADWSDPDRGANQLALAILADATGNDNYALARYTQFKDDVTAQLQPGGGWRVSEGQVIAWVDSHPLIEDDL